MGLIRTGFPRKLVAAIENSAAYISDSLKLKVGCFAEKGQKQEEGEWESENIWSDSNRLTTVQP